MIRIASVLLAMLSLFLFRNAAAAEAGKPNVLIILADDLGWGELGCQGFAKDIPTPHIDSIAKNGVRFTNGYVSGPYCSPTRAGLMTGRYQTRFGHEFNPGPETSADVNFGLPLSEPTIGDRFKAAGYATGWFGKSHLGYQPPFHPLQRGFEYYFGFLGGAHTFLPADDHLILRGTEKAKYTHTTEDFAREAAKFIEQHQAQPWLVYLPFNAVHSPLESTEEYLQRFSTMQDPKRRAFAAMLSAMDDGIGSVLAKIRELKQEENTLVVFFSDNGGPTAQTTSGNGSLRGFKSQTWEGGIRVPFMMQWKGHISAGQVDARPVIQLDILPTSLAAAGIEVKPEWKLDGVNLLPYVTGEKSDSPHEALFWRFGQQIALRKGDWKLVKGAGSAGVAGAERLAKASTEGAELYNLKDDIGEQHNLASRNPQKTQELAALWNQMNSEMVDAKWVPVRPATKKAAGGKKKAKKQ